MADKQGLFAAMGAMFQKNREEQEKKKKKKQSEMDKIREGAKAQRATLDDIYNYQQGK